MKIRNLYIGKIRMITKIDNYSYQESVYGTKLLRQSVLYKLDRKNKAKDIIYGGVYTVGFHGCEEAGDEFVDDLNQQPIINFLQAKGYKKNNINKRKFLRIIKN